MTGPGKFDDIVAELLDDEDSERIAAGPVEDKIVEVRKVSFHTKSQMKKWKVVADAPDHARWREQESFDEAADADEYFEMLIERYGLNEGPKELLDD